MSKRETAKALIPDALIILGGAGVAYGAWLAWAPAGFLSAGAMLLVAGIKIARV